MGMGHYHEIYRDNDGEAHRCHTFIVDTLDLSEGECESLLKKIQSRLLSAGLRDPEGEDYSRHNDRAPYGDWSGERAEGRVIAANGHHVVRAVWWHDLTLTVRPAWDDCDDCPSYFLACAFLGARAEKVRQALDGLPLSVATSAWTSARI